MSGLIKFNGLDRQYISLRNELLEATDLVLTSGQLMNGPFTQELEHKLATMNNTRYAITCHSGTSALEIIAKYHKNNDVKSIAHIPAFTFPATANAFKNANWNINYLNCNNFGQVAPQELPKFDNSCNNLLVAVGIFGEALPEFDVPMVEDGAQHWLSNNCKRQGTTAISFDPTKNLPGSGNGGAIVTNDKDLAEFAKAYRQHGNNTVVGSNSRMSELECAHLLVRLRYLNKWQQRRHDIASYYIDQYSGMVLINNLETHALQKFVISHNDRDRLRHDLFNNRIETRIHYKQPLSERHLMANIVSDCVLSLPLYPELTDSEVERVSTTLLKYA